MEEACYTVHIRCERPPGEVGIEMCVQSQPTSGDLEGVNRTHFAELDKCVSKARTSPWMETGSLGELLGALYTRWSMGEGIMAI